MGRSDIEQLLPGEDNLIPKSESGKMKILHATMGVVQYCADS